MIYGTRSRVFDSDAYGVDTDLPLGVLDWFNPSRKDCEAAQQLFAEAVQEVLIELADYNRIPYETYREWDRHDWDDFREALGI